MSEGLSSAGSVNLIETAFRDAPQVVLRATGPQVVAARWLHRAPAMPDLTLPDHMLVLCLGEMSARRSRDGRTSDTSGEAGSLLLLPSGPLGNWSFDHPAHVFHLYVSDAYLRLVAAQHGLARDSFEVMERIRFRDNFLAEAMADLNRASELGQSASLYASTLGLAIGLRILRDHTPQGLRPQPPAPGRALPAHLLRRACDFMDAHLADGVTLEQVAASVGYSAKHFARSFYSSTRLPPHKWLMGRRIERSKQLLACGDLPLIEIAIACGFSDQSHFTSAFRRAVGVPPGRFRLEVRR